MYISVDTISIDPYIDEKPKPQVELDIAFAVAAAMQAHTEGQLTIDALIDQYNVLQRLFNSSLASIKRTSFYARSLRHIVVPIKHRFEFTSNFYKIEETIVIEELEKPIKKYPSKSSVIDAKPGDWYSIAYNPSVAETGWGSQVELITAQQHLAANQQTTVLNLYRYFQEQDGSYLPVVTTELI